MSESTTAVVAIKVGSAKQEVERHLTSTIEGDLQTLTDDALAPLRNSARLRKIYHVDSAADDPLKPISWNAQAFVIGNMALKGS